MATKTISISVIGDKDFIKRVKILGMRLDKPISVLVREALDSQYGEQLSLIQLDGEGRADASTNAPR